VLLASALAFPLAACGDDDGGSGGDASGEDVYNSNCARCHGPDGEGGTGPELGGGAVAENMSLEEQIDVITNGRGGMPAWGDELSESEIEAVATFEREDLGQ
jgi:cytochrome c oxidase subunit 2